MKPNKCILFSCLFIGLVAMPGFSQENNTTNQKDKSKTESSKTTSLQKIASGSQLRDLDIEINIDQQALEASIESAIKEATESVEASLEGLVINLEPNEIDLCDLNINIQPPIINIPDLDINIEPIEIEPIEIEIDINNFTIDIDENRSDWESDEDNDDNDQYYDNDKDNNEDKNKEKNKVKDTEMNKSNKSDKEVTDKSKGLKKIK